MPLSEFFSVFLLYVSNLVFHFFYLFHFFRSLARLLNVVVVFKLTGTQPLYRPFDRIPHHLLDRIPISTAFPSLEFFVFLFRVFLTRSSPFESSSNPPVRDESIKRFLVLNVETLSHSISNPPRARLSLDGVSGAIASLRRGIGLFARKRSYSRPPPRFAVGREN